MSPSVRVDENFIANAARALEDRGGWLNPDSAHWFADYAALVHGALIAYAKYFDASDASP